MQRLGSNNERLRVTSDVEVWIKLAWKLKAWNLLKWCRVASS